MAYHVVAETGENAEMKHEVETPSDFVEIKRVSTGTMPDGVSQMGSKDALAPLFPSPEFWGNPVRDRKLRCFCCRLSMFGRLPECIPLRKGVDANRIVAPVVTHRMACSKRILLSWRDAASPDALQIVDDIWQDRHRGGLSKLSLNPTAPLPFFVPSGCPDMLRRYNLAGITMPEYDSAIDDNHLLIYLRPPFVFEKAELLARGTPLNVQRGEDPVQSGVFLPDEKEEDKGGEDEKREEGGHLSPFLLSLMDETPIFETRVDGKSGELEYVAAGKQFLIGRPMRCTVDMIQRVFPEIHVAEDIFCIPFAEALHLRCRNCDVRIKGQLVPIPCRRDTFDKKVVILNVFAHSLECSKSYIENSQDIFAADAIALLEEIRRTGYHLMKVLIPPADPLSDLSKFNPSAKLTHFAHVTLPPFDKTGITFKFEDSSLIARRDPGPIDTSSAHPVGSKLTPRMYSTSIGRVERMTRRVAENQAKAAAAVKMRKEKGETH